MKIFTPNTVILSADINANFGMVSGLGRCSSKAYQGSNEGTTSASYVEINPTYITGTLVSKGGDLLVTVFAGLYCSTLTAWLGIKIGTSTYDVLVTNNTAQPDTSSGTILITDIPAGTYTCRLVLKAQSGATAYVNAYKQCGFSVVELAD